MIGYRDYLVCWLTSRAEAYREDARHREYAKPGERVSTYSDGLTIPARRAVADELDQLAQELGGFTVTPEIS